MLSTIFLREMANNPIQTLLYGQYEFDSILREKIRYGHPFYVVKWKKAVPTLGNVIYEGSSEGFGTGPEDAIDVDEAVDLTDESDSPKIHIQDGCSFLLTDENMDLVGAAYPEQTAKFLQEKVIIVCVFLFHSSFLPLCTILLKWEWLSLVSFCNNVYKLSFREREGSLLVGLMNACVVFVVCECDGYILSCNE